MENHYFRVPYNQRKVDIAAEMFARQYPLARHWYVNYLEIRNYYIGLFENDTDDESFEEIENQFFQYLWMYGEIAVTRFGKKMQLWMVETKYNVGIETKRVKVRLIQENLPFAYSNPNKEIVLTPDVNCILVKWNPTPMNSIVIWRQFCEDFVNLEMIFLNNCIWDSKRFMHMLNNKDSEIVKREQASFTNIKTPFIELINPPSYNKGNLQQNMFMEFKMGDSRAQSAYDNLLNYTNYVYNKQGIMVPQSLKKERKTTAESQQDIYNTVNIENITLRELKKFAKKAKDIWNIELDFKKTTDIMEIKDRKEFVEESSQVKGKKNEKV